MSVKELLIDLLMRVLTVNLFSTSCTVDIGYQNVVELFIPLDVTHIRIL